MEMSFSILLLTSRLLGLNEILLCLSIFPRAKGCWYVTVFVVLWKSSISVDPLYRHLGRVCPCYLLNTVSNTANPIVGFKDTWLLRKMGNGNLASLLRRFVIALPVAVQILWQVRHFYQLVSSHPVSLFKALNFRGCQLISVPSWSTYF